jgi:hypothetical protein
VTFNLQNTGAVTGTEILQVYLHYPTNSGEPPAILHGFTDVELQPGETQTVTTYLSRYDLSIWDIAGQSYVHAPWGRTPKYFTTSLYKTTVKEQLFGRHTRSLELSRCEWWRVTFRLRSGHLMH